MAVFVLGYDGKPLMPCSEKRARLLLERKRAIVKRVRPFIIQLTDRNQNNSIIQELEVKIDPGSKVTGICLSRTIDKIVNVISLLELTHRGNSIKNNLDTRRAFRRLRRSRKTRYREPRFDNRTRSKGWLPPSLKHRVETTMSWINRLTRWSPVTSLAAERVKFDMQKIINPDIEGIEYQQGPLFRYELKEYVLEKFNRTCIYCGIKEDFLELEHIVAKSRGGTNRLSNLGLSCRTCNQAKSNIPIEVFLANKPKLLAKIKQQLKIPLKDAAAVNATRNNLFLNMLKTGLPVSTGTGAQTKFNRSKFKIPKTHALDAACVGDIKGVNIASYFHLGIKSTGRGRYGRTRTNKYGNPIAYSSKSKKIFGFSTGDIVKTIITNRKKEIKYIIGRIATRISGYFSILYNNNFISTKWNNCILLQRNDGYNYNKLIF